MSFRILNTTAQINRQFIRSFKSDLKIKWVRPEKIACIDPRKSGDTGKLTEIDPNEFLLEYRGIKELENADEQVKQMFKLEYNPRFLTSDVHRINLITDVQRHKLDYGSVESRVAGMTATIRRFQKLLEEQPRNTRMKVITKEMIDKRQKFLKYLRRWDYKRFEWLIEKLELVYKTQPPYERITRKQSLIKLTDIHCENIKSERLEEYRKELESKQIAFLEKKFANLQFIKKEQEECQIKVTVSQDDINKVKKQLDELKEIRSMLQQQENKNES